MTNIATYYKTAEETLATPIEDLAPTLLRLARAVTQPAGFLPENVGMDHLFTGEVSSPYPFHKKVQVENRLSEAWDWIDRNELIRASSGMNGRLGWKVLTEKGQRVAEGEDPVLVTFASMFPKNLLHPRIRDRAHSALHRSARDPEELVSAVRDAFVSLEDAIREAVGLPRSIFGADLIRDAFHSERGPLRDTDLSKPPAERQALYLLFSGAFGRFRNPTSHGARMSREDAIDQLLLASHLLRIVDQQRTANGL